MYKNYYKNWLLNYETALKISIVLFSLISILLGLFVLNNEDQMLSKFRIYVLGYFTIFLGLSLLFTILKKNILIITFNSILLLLLSFCIYEIFLIYKKNQEIENFNNNLNSASLINENNNLIQICPIHILDENNIKLIPLAGLSNTNIKKINTITKEISLKKSDRYGFNNNDNSWDYDETFAVFIGDSFTYGLEVKHEESYFELFRKKIPNVINLGCSGNGPISELATFIEYAKLLKPKFIIWNYYENDLTKDLDRELKSKISNYLDVNFKQNLIYNQQNIDIFLKDFLDSNINKKNKIQKKEKGTYLNFYKLIFFRTKIGLTHKFSNSNFQKFKDIILRVKNESQNWGGEMVFVYIPTMHKYNNFISYFDEEYYYKNIENFLKSEEIEIINLDLELKKYGNQKEFYSNHFNKKGNEVVSKILLQKIKKID